VRRGVPDRGVHEEARPHQRLVLRLCSAQNASPIMASLFLAISEPPELPRLNSAVISALGRAAPRSFATSWRMYSANETPISLAFRFALRWISGSKVICVRAIITAPSYRPGVVIWIASELIAPSPEDLP